VGKYEEISQALRTLGLYEAVTVREIKSRYRELLREWHPDVSGTNEDACKEKTIEITAAYRTLMNYCEQYRFSFSKEEVEKYISPEELWEKQFGRDPIWGNFNSDDTE
jgi:DnaJ-class molecular chaperone